MQAPGVSEWKDKWGWSIFGMGGERLVESLSLRLVGVFERFLTVRKTGMFIQGRGIS
jgi:hypothetical protein